LPQFHIDWLVKIQDRNLMYWCLTQEHCSH
jgi:hypothetical protein